MPINKNHIGFGSILQDEEVIVDVFRKKKSYIISRMILWGSLFLGAALTVRWFNPSQLLYIWLGIIALGLGQIANLFLWWHMNAVLMTNASLIKVTWKKFLEKSTTRIDYWDIDEIEVVQKGINAMIYHFGDIHITKTSGGEPVKFGPLHHPQEIADTIAHFKEQVVHNKNFTEDAGIKDLLTQLISRHVEESGHPGVTPTVKRTAAPAALHSKRIKDQEKKRSRFWVSTKKKKQPETPEIQNEEPLNQIIHKKLDNTGGFEIDL